MEEEKKAHVESSHTEIPNVQPIDEQSIKPARAPLSLVSPALAHPLLSSPINQTIQPLSPVEMVSPMSNVSDSDDDSDSEDEATKLARSQAIYERPLIYHKRVSSLVDQSKIDQHTIPSQIFMPDGSQMIGLPYGYGAKQNEEENERNFMIFSLPTDEMRARRRIMGMLLYALLPVDIALCAVIYANADWLQSASFSEGRFNTESFVTVILMCVLCGMAVRLRGTRLLTLAACLFCIDACINLLRCFNVVQIAHFVLELTIAAVTMHFKQCCQPTWFTPRL